MKEYNLKIGELLHKHFYGTITPEESRELWNWINSSEKYRNFYDELKEKEPEESLNFYRETDVKAAYKRFTQQTGIRQTPMVRILCRYAAFLVLLLSSSLFLLNRLPNKPDLATFPPSTDFPGGYQATLILPDSLCISLQQGQNACIPALPEATVTDNGQELTYMPVPVASHSTPYHHLITPYAKEYLITLSDGSRVHLNSASTLNYPVVFSGEEREVYLDGEARFEIAKDQQRPFKVRTKGVITRAYGTSFNINTYHPDKIQIILIDGIVGISGDKDTTEQIIHPSQLAEYTPSGTLLQTASIDIQPYLDWSDGIFSFRNERLEDILVQFAQWYGLGITYIHPQLKDLKFTGTSKRSEQPENILNAINKIHHVNIKINQKTIIVE